MNLEEQIKKKRQELAALTEKQTAETMELHGHYIGKCFQFSKSRCVYVESILSATPLEVRAIGVNVYFHPNQCAFHANDGITINLREKPTEITTKEFKAFVKVTTDRINNYLEVIN